MGSDAGVEHLDDLLDERGPDGRVTLGEGVHPQQHGGAHDLRVQGLADSRGVGEDEPALELLLRTVVDALVRELAEARVDAVDGIAVGHELLERPPSGGDAPAGLLGQHDLRALAGDLDDILEREGLAVGPYVHVHSSGHPDMAR